MKELETPHLQLRPDTQLVAEVNKEYTLKMQIIKRPGLILFGVNPTKEYHCEKINITTEGMLTLNKSVVTKNRAFYNPNLVYVYAINEKNAVRKVKKHYIS